MILNEVTLDRNAKLDENERWFNEEIDFLKQTHETELIGLQERLQEQIAKTNQMAFEKMEYDKLIFENLHLKKRFEDFNTLINLKETSFNDQVIQLNETIAKLKNQINRNNFRASFSNLNSESYNNRDYQSSVLSFQTKKDDDVSFQISQD